MRSFLVFAFCLMALAGCTSMPHPEGKPMPHVTFQHLDPLMLDVAKVEIINKTEPFPALRQPSFVVPVDEMMKRYLARRFQAGESLHPFNPSELSITIERAEIEHRRSTGESQTLNYFDIGGFDDYIVHYDVVFSAFNRKGYAQRSIGIKLSRRVSITEHASIARREADQLASFEALMRDFDVRAVEVVRDQLGL